MITSGREEEQTAKAAAKQESTRKKRDKDKAKAQQPKQGAAPAFVDAPPSASHPLAAPHNPVEMQPAAVRLATQAAKIPTASEDTRLPPPSRPAAACL